MTLSRHEFISSIVVSVFLAVVGLWIPFVHLYLLNAANYTLPLSVHLPLLCTLSIAVVAAAFVMQILGPSRFRTATSCLLLSLGVFLWAEGTLFIGDFGFFRGGDIDWDKNRYLLYLELPLVVLLVFLAFRFKRRFVRKAVLITSLLTVSSLLNLYQPLRVDLSRTKTSIHHVFNHEGVFRVSPTRNVLIFIIDTLQSDVLAEVIADNPRWKDLLDGFTFFPDATSAFPMTYASVPNILTGTAFDNSQPYPIYLRDAYLDHSAPKVLKDHGFDVRYRVLWPQPYFAHPDVADNLSVIGGGVGPQWAQRHEFIELCNLALFRLSPFLAKPWAYSDNDFLIREPSIPEAATGTSGLFGSRRRVFSKGNKVKDLEFLDQMMTFLSADGDRPAFRVYHLRGVHAPIILDEDLNFLGKQPPTRAAFRAQTEGMLKLLTLVFDRLRHLGAYDESLIFVVGDHGTDGNAKVGVRGDAIRRLGLDIDFSPAEDSARSVPVRSGIPAVIVKRMNQSGAMAISRSPVALGDIPNTIFSELGYVSATTGPSMFDIPESSERNRYHSHYSFLGWGQDYIIPITDYVISGFSWDPASWSLSGRNLNRHAVESFAGELIVLTQGGNFDDFVHGGWSAPSTHGCRILAGSASIIIPVEKGSGTLGLNIRLNPFRSPLTSVPMSVLVNNHFVASWAVSTHAPDRLRAFIPEHVRQVESDLDIRFELGTAGAKPFLIEISVVHDQEEPSYAVGDSIVFSRGGNSSDYLSYGWAAPEEWGTWMSGSDARLYLCLGSVPDRHLEVEARFRPKVPEKMRPLLVEVMANGKIVTQWSFSSGEWQTRTFQVPRSSIGDSRILDLSFAIRNPPSTRPDRKHKGALRWGLGFEHLVIREAEVVD